MYRFVSDEPSLKPAIPLCWLKRPAGKILHIPVKKYKRENVATAAQKVLEDRLLELVSNAVEEMGEKRIALAGGVFLNVKVNIRIREELGLDEVFIYPNDGDGGNAVGSFFGTLLSTNERKER